MMRDIIKVVVLVLSAITLGGVKAMNCFKECENAKDYRTCLTACLDRSKSQPNYKNPLTEEAARAEWSKRYPCTSFEESDCYYPYRGDYKQGIKDDNKKRAAYTDDDYQK